ncbi:hypothetical protein C1H46_041522 [Malus baccata]|uniref:Uncharacterized protein n=1 Tax=Malus baccata TaxID=106549 RepID=A0A540KFD5_MALBA|nr:hypothetical protein C1H46_041522 [Malus baccata]
MESLAKLHHRRLPSSPPTQCKSSPSNRRSNPSICFVVSSAPEALSLSHQVTVPDRRKLDHRRSQIGTVNHHRGHLQHVLEPSRRSPNLDIRKQRNFGRDVEKVVDKKKSNGADEVIAEAAHGVDLDGDLGHLA